MTDSERRTPAVETDTQSTPGGSAHRQQLTALLPVGTGFVLSLVLSTLDVALPGASSSSGSASAQGAMR